MPLAERHANYVRYECEVQGLPYLGESKQQALFAAETRDRTVEAL